MADTRRTRQVFGEVLRHHRTKAGLSQEQVAEKADLHWTYVSQLERGQKQPTLSVVLALAAAVGVAGRDLVADVESALKQP